MVVHQTRVGEDFAQQTVVVRIGGQQGDDAALAVPGGLKAGDGGDGCAGDQIDLAAGGGLVGFAQALGTGGVGGPGRVRLAQPVTGAIEQQVELGGTGEEDSYTWTELLNSNPQLVTEDCARYYDSYYRQGISSLNRGEVPPPLENYLRAYFQAIAPPSS